MATDKHGFSIDQHTGRDGTIAELSYGGVIRVLGGTPDLRALGTSYYVVEAAPPMNPSQPDKPVRYSCNKRCAMCTTPKCITPPLPTVNGKPQRPMIAVKRPVELATLVTGGPLHLLAGNDDPGISIPVFDGPADRKLSAALRKYLRAAEIDQPVRFHVYQITRAGGALAELQDKLIAIPVIPDDVRIVVAARIKRAA